MIRFNTTNQNLNKNNKNFLILKKKIHMKKKPQFKSIFKKLKEFKDKRINLLSKTLNLRKNTKKISQNFNKSCLKNN